MNGQLGACGGGEGKLWALQFLQTSSRGGASASGVTTMKLQVVSCLYLFFTLLDFTSALLFITFLRLVKPPARAAGAQGPVGCDGSRFRECEHRREPPRPSRLIGVCLNEGGPFLGL